MGGCETYFKILERYDFENIKYFKGNSTGLQITGFYDADFASDAENRKSITGFVVMMSREL